MNDTERISVRNRAFGPYGFLTVAVVFPVAVLYGLAMRDADVPGVPLPIWSAFAVGWLVAFTVGGRARELAVGLLLGGTGLLVSVLLYPSILVLAVALPATVVWAVVVAVRRRGRPDESSASG
ncbi:hypothetical protein ACFVVM_26890 [Nocardia sp. NPDC058176]|uniref:hypothetical protein n=1 Tax=Nocardia sp. NPDC058176 TaxID=3346368 RepID=UPI0036D8D08E